jgi:hypothetical protein
MTGPGRTFAAPVALWLSVAACAAAAFWIADGVAPWDGDRSNVWHHYEYLAQGFLDGHTYLSVAPNPELLKLANPYDPVANASLRLWDASLYDGKYFLYYGPGPAVALMVPWRILTGHMMPQRMAVAVFAAGGLAGLALLLFNIRRRCFPGLSGAALGAILVVAFHAAWLPVILRRPGVWELPIVSATACLWWMLYFLWKFQDTGGKVRWAAACGAAGALMIACRVTNLFEAGFVLLLIVASGAAATRTGRRWTASSVAAGLIGASGIALLLYNHARFGRFLDFGTSHMLLGQEAAHTAKISLSFVPFNLWTYLVAVPELGPYFPFVHAAWPERFPEGYKGYEAMYGALFIIPVQAMGLVAAAWAWRNRADPSLRATAVVVLAAAGSSAFAGAILFTYVGASSRYMTELFAGWTVLTSIGLMAVLGAEGTHRFGRTPRLLAAAAACWTIACVWLASAEFRGFMKETNPRVYFALAHALDRPSQWWIRKSGAPFGPVELDLRIPPAAPLGETVLVASGFPEKVNQLVLERTDESHVRLWLNGVGIPGAETPALPVPEGRLHILLSAPWLYPPAEHPFWDHFSESDARYLQSRFAVEALGSSFSVVPRRAFDPSGFRPAVLEKASAPPDTPYVASIAFAHEP